MQLAHAKQGRQEDASHEREPGISRRAGPGSESAVHPAGRAEPPDHIGVGSNAEADAVDHTRKAISGRDKTYTSAFISGVISFSCPSRKLATAHQVRVSASVRAAADMRVSAFGNGQIRHGHVEARKHTAVPQVLTRILHGRCFGSALID